MRVSEYFSFGRSQPILSFVDVDVLATRVYSLAPEQSDCFPLNGAGSVVQIS